MKINKELAELKKRLNQLNEQEELATALGHKFGKLLQARWPASTSHWARAFAAGLIAVEDDIGDRRGCRSLLIQWMMEHFGGFVVDQFLPDINEVHTMLKQLHFTKSDPLVFNSDNSAWYEDSEMSVFIMETQSRRKLVIVNGFEVHARKVWYKYDETCKSGWYKPKSLAWYRKNHWELEYKDSRDLGYILSYGGILSRETVDHADSHWNELEMLIFDIHSTLNALHDIQTERSSDISHNKEK